MRYSPSGIGITGMNRQPSTFSHHACVAAGSALASSLWVMALRRDGGFGAGVRAAARRVTAGRFFAAFRVTLVVTFFAARFAGRFAPGFLRAGSRLADRFARFFADLRAAIGTSVRGSSRERSPGALARRRGSGDQAVCCRPRTPDARGK
jgi:hypothetical protein